MQIRKLRRDEMNAVAAVHRSAFDERLPWLTGLHTLEERRTYFSKKVFIACQVLGAFNDDCLVGFVAFRKGWIDHLYVHPQTQARGAGTALLDCAKAVEPVLRLWTFQKNTAARRFYEQRGFKAIDQTDGTANEEREPDILYEWRSRE